MIRSALRFLVYLLVAFRTYGVAIVLFGLFSVWVGFRLLGPAAGVLTCALRV